VKGKAIFLLSVILLAGLVSCRTSRPLIPSSTAKVTAADYIKSYSDLAVSEMRRTGVPASITLAQGMLESDFGRSSLARLGNNHFGIKCHNGWTGQTIRQHDDRRNECFRKYRRPEDSFYDHSDFLKTGSRYSFLFDIDPLDYKAWAHGLKRAGYATNPDYANLLIRKIEENRLYDLDRSFLASSGKPQGIIQVNEVPSTTKTGNTETPKAGSTEPPKTSNIEPPKPGNAEPVNTQAEAITFGDVLARAPRIMENNRIQYIIVKDGETREKLENDFELLKWELARYNDLDENFYPFPGQMLYLGPKRERAETGIEFHIVAAGETMYTISQKYGIKLKSLLEMNRMAEGGEPTPGQKIWLQGIKPLN
jgi:LysM repeat protein